MERLWAPWRMAYIGRPQGAGCFLCDMFGRDEDEQRLVLRRGPQCALVMNKYPYTNGHLMVAPYRHVDGLEGLTPAERADLMDLTALAVNALKATIRPQGFNIGMNLGAVAGAGLKDHVHQHIVPRWEGDTNFMPVLGDVRIIPQALDELYAKLRQELAGLP